MQDRLQQNKSTEPHDDRWHYLDFEDKKHTKNYFEWKYFNFIGKDVEGYIMYYILDPEGKTKIGGGRILVRILKNGVSYGLIKKIPMNQVEFDAISAGVRMGKSKIVEHDSYHYDLLCDYPDISWNLNYRQDVPSIESFQNTSTGILRWEKINWLIKMPKANVKGEIRIGKDIFQIDGCGYSDTNWGEFVPFFSKYEWGQFNDESFSLVFGVLYGLGKIKSSYFYLVTGKHVISLENAECGIKHIEWKKDRGIGIKVPSKSIFSVRNSEYEVKFLTTLIHSDNPGIKVHPLLPNSVVSEQIVIYEGRVSKNGETIHEFKGKGFEEWSGKTWKEVPVAF